LGKASQKRVFCWTIVKQPSKGDGPYCAAPLNATARHRRFDLAFVQISAQLPAVPCSAPSRQPLVGSLAVFRVNRVPDLESMRQTRHEWTAGPFVPPRLCSRRPSCRVSSAPTPRRRMRGRSGCFAPMLWGEPFDGNFSFCVRLNILFKIKCY
jgi:hypothetical protein